MPGLLDAALPFHRGLAQAQMPDTGTRVRPTAVSDNQGGLLPGTPDTSLAFPCRLQARPAQSQELSQAGRVVAVMTWKLECPHGTDLKPPDRVTVNGGTFEVIDDADKRSSAVVMSVNLREIR
jgi:hypothetical protein